MTIIEASTALNEPLEAYIRLLVEHELTEQEIQTLILAKVSEVSFSIE